MLVLPLVSTQKFSLNAPYDNLKEEKLEFPLLIVRAVVAIIEENIFANGIYPAVNYPIAVCWDSQKAISTRKASHISLNVPILFKHNYKGEL